MWHDPPDVRPADGSGRTPSASASERSIALAFENELAEAEQMLDSGSSRLGVTGASRGEELGVTTVTASDARVVSASDDEADTPRSEHGDDGHSRACVDTALTVEGRLNGNSRHHVSSASVGSATCSIGGSVGSDVGSDVGAYELEADNERLRDELREATAQLEACNQQLLAYDVDINKLLTTVATLTAERKRLVVAVAEAENAARSAEARCERKDEELASLRRQVAELEECAQSLHSKLAARVDRAGRERGATHGAAHSSTVAPSGQQSDRSEPTADYFKEQLVIAKVKLAEASARNDVHVKRTRDLEEQLAHVKLQLARATAASEDNAVAVDHYKAAASRRDEQLVALTQRLHALQATSEGQLAALEAYRTGKLRKGRSKLFWRKRPPS